MAEPPARPALPTVPTVRRLLGLPVVLRPRAPAATASHPHPTPVHRIALCRQVRAHISQQSPCPPSPCDPAPCPATCSCRASSCPRRTTTPRPTRRTAPPCFGSPAVLRSAVPCTPCTGWRCVCGCEHSFPSDPSVAMPVLRIPRGCCVPTAALPSALDRAARRCEHSPQQSPMCHIALRSCSVPEPPARAGRTTALAVRRLLGLTVVLRLRARCGAVPQTALRLRPCGSPVVLRSPFPRAFPVVPLPGPHPPGAVGLLSSGAAPERHRRSVLLPVAW